MAELSGLPATPPIPRVATFKTVAAFRQHLAKLGLSLACDDEVLPPDQNPLAEGLKIGKRQVGNRFTVHPMEGWDGTPDGQPSDLTIRRWRAFGTSGAKLIWGGEAFAVRRDGRANPHQLYYSEANRKPMADLLNTLKLAHRRRFATVHDLYVGLQLTHSGRYCRPEADHALRPRVAYRHPLLDPKFGVQDDGAVFTDAELGRLIQDYVTSAKAAQEAGFEFVDVKHCHGYLLHELLSANTRTGPYGGSFENRTRMLREIVAAIRRDVQGLDIAVRVSAWDLVPFQHPPAGAPKRGVPVDYESLLPYRYAFGVNADDPLRYDLTEPIRFLKLCQELGIQMVNVSCASPYYNPHLMRPAFFPPSDGYPPPEDPLIGVARQIDAVAELKRTVPGLVLVGTGYTYLQDYLPHVAQAQVRLGRVDSVGLGRMMLSYPDLPADVVEGRPLKRTKFCRTFSDCTTAPRNHLVSGCYPLDDFYKQMPEAKTLKDLKKAQGVA
jgi:2,4-dienoyl-CoA reductase-like NADH-dependent reductase (Old Yellow Enzyme family)